MQTSIVPWINYKNCADAVAFYKKAFGAVETYRLEMPEGLIVRLSVGGSEFWLSSSDDKTNDLSANNAIRMILTVEDPHEVFAQSIAAGAKEIFPVGEDHGWRLGRIEDPFGLHWEIGHPLNEQ